MHGALPAASLSEIICLFATVQYPLCLSLHSINMAHYRPGASWLLLGLMATSTVHLALRLTEDGLPSNMVFYMWSIVAFCLGWLAAGSVESTHAAPSTATTTKNKQSALDAAIEHFVEAEFIDALQQAHSHQQHQQQHHTETSAGRTEPANVDEDDEVSSLSSTEGELVVLPQGHHAQQEQDGSESKTEITTSIEQQQQHAVVVATTNHEEQQYLRLARRCLEEGYLKPNRTGIAAYTVPGVWMEFDLRNNTIPALTTKRLGLKTVLRELLFFISGSTDTKDLEAKGVRIWTGNTSREALDAAGFPHRREGCMGPGYGFQWRHAGAAYEGPDADYAGKGTDQLQGIIDGLKAGGTSRRLLCCAWNVKDVPNMTLPPCHLYYQVVPNPEKKEFTMFITIRSNDWGLGAPYNLVSYAMLAHMIAHVSGYTAVGLKYAAADCHVYENHVKGLREQLKRQPVAPFPTMSISAPPDCGIDDITEDHIAFHNYVYDPTPLPPMPMAV